MYTLYSPKSHSVTCLVAPFFFSRIFPYFSPFFPVAFFFCGAESRFSYLKRSGCPSPAEDVGRHTGACSAETDKHPRANAPTMADADTTTIDDEPLWLFGYGSLLFKPPLHHLPLSKDLRRFDGHVNGYVRRFWQSSYDNRGTPEYKGRVVTIVPAAAVAATPAFHDSVREHELRHLPPPAADAVLADPARLAGELALGGCVYYVPPQHARAARAYLDFREKDGYAVEEIDFVVGTPAGGSAADGGYSDEDREILAGLPRDAVGRPLIRCVVYVGSPTNESFVGPEDNDTTAAIIHRAVGPSGPNVEYLMLLQEQDPEDTYLQSLKQRVERLSAVEPSSSSRL